jgi:hypothetical protein
MTGFLSGNSVVNDRSITLAKMATGTAHNLFAFDASGDPVSIGDLPVAQGGTGASTASAALAALGGAGRGPNSDITSITGLTTDLSVAQGGTGAGTAGAARTSLGVRVSGKGADIASATALALGADGDSFDVTGTTTITSIGTVAIGMVATLQFDAVLILTHHATDLILPGAANITTAAGDIGVFVEYAAGDWRCSSYTKASGEALVSVGGGLQSVQSFAPTEFTGTPLSTTWTRPAGIKTIRVQLIGGGASGNSWGKAGGAGGYSEKIIDVTSISSVAVTVGNRVLAHGNSGIATSFGSHCSATGGLATNPHTGNTSGATGGVGTGGDINIQGGGGSSNHSDGGTPGAVGYFGGGSFGQSTSNLGDHPAAYGSGGSGCNNGYNSGSGARGLVIVWEYA